MLLLENPPINKISLIREVDCVALKIMAMIFALFFVEADERMIVRGEEINVSLGEMI